MVGKMKVETKVSRIDQKLSKSVQWTYWKDYIYCKIKKDKAKLTGQAIMQMIVSQTH